MASLDYKGGLREWSEPQSLPVVSGVVASVHRSDGFMVDPCSDHFTRPDSFIQLWCGLFSGGFQLANDITHTPKSRPDRQSDIRYRDDSNRPAFICRADTVRDCFILWFSDYKYDSVR